MQQITRTNYHPYTVFEYKETCDNDTRKVDYEEERVRLQLEEIVLKTNVLDELYASCIAQYQIGHIDGIFDQITSLNRRKKDLEMQRSILSDRLLTVKNRFITVEHDNSDNILRECPQPMFCEPVVIPRVELWSMDVYNHTNLRTLNKRKFVSPISVLGGSAGSSGQYNYSYFNDQPSDDEVQIIEHCIGTDPAKKTAPTFPIPCAVPTVVAAAAANGGGGGGATGTGINTVHINDIVSRTEDTRHVIIVRGLPGSGKSSFCQSFKDTEIRNGHSAPRILSIDHFFMDDGTYEYDATMEPIYRQELFKLFKRQIDEGFFPVILVDSINERTEQFSQFYHYGRIHGYQASILELKVSPTICAKRCEHKVDPLAIYQLADNWQETPTNFLKLDATSFLQDSSIEDVEMEDIVVESVADSSSEDDDDDEDDDDEVTASGFFKSKWDEDFQETKERLDGTNQLSHEQHNAFSIQDFLKLQEEEDLYKCSKAGDKSKGKQVKWADFEELKQQKRRKERGFVAGYTDWNKIMSDDIEVAEAALVQVRFFVKD